MKPGPVLRGLEVTVFGLTFIMPAALGVHAHTAVQTVSREQSLCLLRVSMYIHPFCASNIWLPFCIQAIPLHALLVPQYAPISRG